MYHRAPGITSDATEWLKNYPAFFQQVWIGVFTLDCKIFDDISLVTVENLLDDNYTKGYLKRRMTVDSSTYFAKFDTYPVSLSDVRLVDGEGVDGVTNTMAAALWMIDFSL